jgi:hypothetical protein
VNSHLVQPIEYLKSRINGKSDKLQTLLDILATDKDAPRLKPYQLARRLEMSRSSLYRMVGSPGVKHIRDFLALMQGMRAYKRCGDKERAARIAEYANGDSFRIGVCRHFRLTLPEVKATSWQQWIDAWLVNSGWDA